MEPQFDPGVEVPPDIAEASKTSWLYRSSKSPPNRGKSPPAANRSLHRKQEAESCEGRKRSPSPLQPRIRVRKKCSSWVCCVDGMKWPVCLYKLVCLSHY